MILRKWCGPDSHRFNTRLTGIYRYNTTDRGGGLFFAPPPLITQELLVGFTKFKRRSIDPENLSKETECC